MKKILIALVAVAVATVTNAAAINWSVTAINASPAANLTGANQWSAYFFATADSSSQLTLTTIEAVVAEIGKGAAGDVASLASYSAQNTYVASTSRANFSSSGNGAFTAGTTVSGFVVIFDSTDAASADYYMLAQTSGGENVLTKTAAATGNMSFSFGSQASVTGGWTAVPEPTSGLLLLLGMAGLALKRKRA